MAKPRQPKRGRPRAEIDFMRVEELASVGLSAEQIAAELNVHQRTIERNFAAVLKKGRHKRNSRLQLKLYREAMNGNTRCGRAFRRGGLGWPVGRKDRISLYGRLRFHHPGLASANRTV